MDSYPPHGTGTGVFPRPGCVATDEVANTSEVGQKVRVHLGGGRREEAGFDPMNTVVQYFAKKPILGLCEVEESNNGAWVGMQWWEQAGKPWYCNHG